MAKEEANGMSVVERYRPIVVALLWFLILGLFSLIMTLRLGRYDLLHPIVAALTITTAFLAYVVHRMRSEIKREVS